MKYIKIAYDRFGLIGFVPEVDIRINEEKKTISINIGMTIIEFNVQSSYSIPQYEIKYIHLMCYITWNILQRREYWNMIYSIVLNYIIYKYYYLIK